MNRRYRKTIIAGNWKMNKTASETKKFAEELKAILPKAKWCDVVVCVPAVNIPAAMKAFKDAGLGVENSPLITKSFTYFYNWIKDGTSEDELAKYLDLNVAPFTWEATKNYLQDANTKYNEGLIDPEFYLTTMIPLPRASLSPASAPPTASTCPTAPMCSTA